MVGHSNGGVFAARFVASHPATPALVWSCWRSELPRICDRWAADHPLTPGMPRTAAVQRLRLPENEVLDVLVEQLPSLTSDGDGIHGPAAIATLRRSVRASLNGLVRRLAKHPFEAPDASELAVGALSERYLAVAVKNGELVRIAPGIYLLPDAVEEVVRRLRTLPQPFTTSAARRVLETTRRVAVRCWNISTSRVAPNVSTGSTVVLARMHRDVWRVSVP